MYMLRNAAGIYWLVKINQQDSDYCAPMTINECGAIIWNGLTVGLTIDELSDLLQKQFGIEKEEAVTDVKHFLEKLTNYGIELPVQQDGSCI
ncbi:MAG: hypothetical protein K0S47_28 [Herbinix sp.]|nr:hypothetical protein [Herbinix sp.]